MISKKKIKVFIKKLKVNICQIGVCFCSYNMGGAWRVNGISAINLRRTI